MSKVRMDTLYDYSQPIIVAGAANLAPTAIENPFNTDAEACIELFWGTGTAGNVAIGYDTYAPNTGLTTIGPNLNGALGYLFPLPFVSGFHSDAYIPVKQFLTVTAFGINAASYILIVSWRREKQVFIEVPHKHYNEPTV